MTTLILTLPPHIPGGVATKAKVLADYLRDIGQDVTIAFYAARGKYPELNVSLGQGGASRSPESMILNAFGDHQCVAVGCRFPEIESNYTKPSALWDELIASHDRHIAVGGTVLMAHPLVSAGVRHLVWCASDVEGDRRARRKSMGMARKALDRYYISPKLKAQEQRVLSSSQNKILGVSPFTIDSLRVAQPNLKAAMAVLPIPTDMDFFSPGEISFNKLKSPVIGFAGRLDDPRKNPQLLFQSFAALLARGGNAELRVTGNSTPELLALAHKFKISSFLKFTGRLSRQELRDYYRSLTLFLIPSDQEGLAIVGIEAMACGVPVISTKCGGPEAYVRHGENGFLCDFDADQIAKYASDLLHDEALYSKYVSTARSSVLVVYGQRYFEKNLASEWSNLWQEKLVLKKA